MKKYISKIVLFGLLIGLISCDDNEVNKFSDEDAFFAFEQETASLKENADEAISLSVYVAKSEAIGELAIEVDSEGLDNPALEGVDYEITTGKTISFQGEYYQEVKVKAIDNAVRDKDKQFYINMVSNTINAKLGLVDGKQSQMLITITDDEHPLAALFGELAIFDVSLEPAEYNYDGTLEAHPDDETKAIFTGIWGVEQPIELQFDLESNIVKIPSNQTIYGVNVGVALDFTIYCYKDSEFQKEAFGTYNLETGEIEFPDGYALVCSGPEGSQYVGNAWNWSVQSYTKMTKK